jgi:hypothetical protein
MTSAGSEAAERMRRSSALAMVGEWLGGASFGGTVLACALGCTGRDAFLGGTSDAVCVERCFVDPAISPDAAIALARLPEASDAEATAAPTIVYPLPNSIHPLSLAELTVQWTRGAADSELFRLGFSVAAGTAYQLYVPCLATLSSGCRYAVPTSIWQRLRDEFKGREVALEVSAAVGAERRVVSPTVTFSFTSAVLDELGFYFWSAAPPFSGTFRLPLGAQRAEPFIVPSAKDEQVACIGCHSVSRDGRTIAYTVRGPADSNDDQRAGHLVVVTAARPDEPRIMAGIGYDSSMMALTSDGRRVLVAFEHRLVLRTTVAVPELGLGPGDVIGEVPEALLAPHGRGYFPEFSPDDTQIALAVSVDPDSPHAIRSGSIAALSFDPETNAFGPLQIVVPGTENEFHFYPSWSPDGRFIAFVSAPIGPGQSSYDQQHSRLRLVRLSDRLVVDLTRATQSDSSWSTLPKFAPFDPAQYDGLFFLTFNSKVDYGLLLQNSAIDSEYKIPQLWLSALDPRQLPEDPSSAPIWLPFQDFGQRSHLGFWTEHIGCRQDVPEAARCGPAERCAGDYCVPAIR